MVGPKIQGPRIQRISWTPDTVRDKKEELFRLLDMESLELFALAGPVTAWKDSYYYTDSHEDIDERYWDVFSTFLGRLRRSGRQLQKK